MNNRKKPKKIYFRKEKTKRMIDLDKNRKFMLLILIQINNLINSIRAMKAHRKNVEFKSGGVVFIAGGSDLSIETEREFLCAINRTKKQDKDGR